MNTATMMKPALLFAAGTVATAANAAQSVSNPTIVNNNGMGYAATIEGTNITLVGDQPQYLFQDNTFPFKTYDFSGYNGAQVTETSESSAFYPDANDPRLANTAVFGVKDPTVSARLAADEKFYGLRFTAAGQNYVGYVNVNQAGDFINSIGFELAQDGPLAVPEPSTWALMILGFGGTGLALRRRRRQGDAAAVA